jgi:serine/threonine protein kinase
MGTVEYRTASGSIVPAAITHRDKPDNLLQRKDGSIALADFGFASIQLQCQATPPAGQDEGCPGDDDSDHAMEYAAAMPHPAAAAAAPAALPAVLFPGTPHYMAPELAAARLAHQFPEAATAAAAAAPHFCDYVSAHIYALGVSVLELLVGKLEYRSAWLGYDGLRVQDGRLAALWMMIQQCCSACCRRLWACQCHRQPGSLWGHPGCRLLWCGC